MSRISCISNTVEKDVPENSRKRASTKKADPEDDACLHCSSVLAEVQVSCDECSSYICQSCHWCHEFQANHEIRVCDRCDAFYCRGCDEMDQCDDCGEVVCAACSTLLSCKFCGGGLCEDCATACGRCGIVLCSRDAKFAVDCDTCRLSYCLVCLASGNKDPCVRCSHRPSKRMEQLVHLRLKSIYKAFKQSSNSSTLAASARALKKSEMFAEDAPTEDAEALMMAAAAASALTPPAKKKEPTARRGRVGQISEHKVSTEEYEKKVKRADDAAAALLAELDEEEQAEKKEKSKKSKKRKKKQRQQARRGDEMKPEEDTSSSYHASSFNHHEKGSKEGYDDNDIRSWRSSAASQDADEQIFEVQPQHGSPIETKDPLLVEFEQLDEMEDIEGLEGLLASVKGVPGKAVLRKNVKKALKRLRTPPEQQGRNEGGESAFIPVAEQQSPSSRPGTETPVQIDDDPRVSELLQIISYDHNKTPNGGSRTKVPNPKGSSECIMNMAPIIVGWVIGKGGQRIRDLMEESGARIWIDQDSMKPQEPRVVYVSGSRKNVDTAIRMIKDLIAKAPCETPKSVQSTPGTETGPTKTASTTGEKGPGLPKDFSAGVTSFQLKPREIAGAASNRTKYEMTCDPRFVPLLIGRRGWTIKNIQDASGARIDIDQTVTPRKITISGDQSSVEIATDMVGDVLSYPQSQLHGADDEAGPAVAAEKIEKQDVFRRLSNSDIGPTAPVPPSARAETSPPPPASEIVAGGGKDADSASSSLSSTPESTTAMVGSQGNIGDPLLPSSAHSSGLPNDPIGIVCSGPINSNPFDESADGHAVARAFPARAVEVPFGLAVAGNGPLDSQFPAGPPVAEQVEVGTEGHFSGQPGPSQFAGSAFEATRHVPPLPLAPSLADRPVIGAGDTRPEAELPDIWNPSRTIPEEELGRRDEFGLAAAVDFLHHSQTAHPVGVIRADQPMNTDSSAHPSSLPNTFPPGGTLSSIGQSTMFNPPAVKDDAKMVDSLFGPAEPSRADVGLIAGLDGLAIGASTEGTSIWASGGSTDEGKQDILGLGGLLPVPQPPIGLSDTDHSRFAWGSSD